MSNTTQRSDFGTLFQELLSTRAHYESLRMGGAPFSERAATLERLHGLRHDMDVIRRTAR